LDYLKLTVLIFIKLNDNKSTLTIQSEDISIGIDAFTPIININNREILIHKLLNMQTNKITNLLTPLVSTDASTKGYVDRIRNSKVSKSGDTMTGNLTFDATGDKDIKIFATNISTNNSFKVGLSESDCIMFKNELGNNTGVGIVSEYFGIGQNLTSNFILGFNTSTGNLIFDVNYTNNIDIIAERIPDTKHFKLGTNSQTAFIEFNHVQNTFECNINSDTFSVNINEASDAMIITSSNIALTKPIEMGNNKIINLSTPTLDKDQQINYMLIQLIIIKCQKLEML